MSRHPNIVPSISLKTNLPIDIRTKLDLHLFSELEGRVPHGAYQKFLVEIINQYFDSRHLDLAPYLGTLPTVAVIRGAPMVIDLLKDKLEGPSITTYMRGTSDAG